MKKVKAILLSVFSIVSSMTFAQNPNSDCVDMLPICTDDILVFDINATGGGLTPGNFYDCLVPTIGTNWFYLKIGNSGNIDMTLTAPPGVDLDFAVWGPFTDLAAAIATCGNLGNQTTPPSTVDCSALGGNTEQISIPNGITGEVYVMLVTIPATSSSTTFELTLDPTSTGSTDCSIVCDEDPGTFSLMKATDPNDPATFVPTTSPISLCAGEGFSIMSMQDYVLPDDTISIAAGGDSAYTAQLMFLLYDAPPVTGDPASDPGFLDVIIPADTILDINSPFTSFILDSLNINCGTVFFVPVTGDDGIGLNGNMPGTGDNGQINYDLLGDGCVVLGEPIEVRYLCQLTVNGTILCTPNDNTISINVNGGADNEVFAYTFKDGILSDNIIQTPDVISVSNLMHLDTVELFFEDSNGCFDSLKVNFSIPQFDDVTMVPSAGCALPGEVSVIADPLTGNGGIASITMNSILETITVPFDTINANGGTQVTIVLTDQVGCTNDSTVTIDILNGHKIIANVIPDSTFGVSCRNGSDGRATVTAYGVDQFLNPDGIPIISYVWTHSPTGVTFGGTAVDSMLTGAIPGTWTVTITDQVGCTATLNIIIDNPDEFETTVVSSSPVCVGESNGSLNIIATGGTTPYTFSVVDANNDPVPNQGAQVLGLSAGLYSITLVDDNGCSTTFTTTLNDPPEIVATFNQTDIIKCYGDSTGFISALNVANAVEPFGYSWEIPGSSQPIDTNSTVNNLPAGLYSLEIRDANGCVKSWDFTIEQEDSIYFQELVIRPAYCRTASNQNGSGELSVVGAGGVGNFKFIWKEINTGATQITSTWAARNPGPYNIFMSDGNGCELSQDLFLDSINPTAVMVVTSDDFEGPELYEGTEPLRVRFQNESFGYADSLDAAADTVFQWTFNRNPADGSDPNWFFTFSEDTRVDTTYTGEGRFIACLVTKNYNDCGDTTCVEIISRADPVLILPNVFTPGEAPNNEFFFPNVGLNEFKAVVFNRYGIPVFEFNDITDKWDGTNKDSGNECSDGVYFYSYSGTSTNGTEFKGEGTVTLLRTK